MFKFNCFIFAFCSLLSVCVGQIVQNGQCDPDITLSADFDLESFAGLWYEIQISDNPDQNTVCSTFEITTSGNTINVQHSGLIQNFPEESSGTATLIAGTAKLSLNIPMFSSPRDFWVLLTDNINYAVTYSCENITPTQRSIHLWILSNQNSYLNQMVPAFINIQLNNLFGITLDDLKTIDHSDNACYVLPEIEPGQSIVIPGQCDTSIQVEQNFRVADFTGIWHQVSSYYSESSTGSCVRAIYTAGNDVVNVVNRQIINQALLTIAGTATVTSTDNSARLRVILNVNNQNVEQDLWVIATDYTNYAISYSCENIGNTQRRIYSWILSRERELSSTAQPEVTRVVESILELNNRYYLPTDQSRNGCVYVPEPVRVQGQCDLTIPVVTNFDATRYLDLWYDIESYPAPFQSGTCATAIYSSNTDGSVHVENTQVLNQVLDTWIGSAVVASDDGSAKLDVTFNIDGIDVTSKYWVLATDYDSYALVYSCQNVDATTKTVFSWKLSRTPELTAAATTAINAVINSIPDLEQQYYIEKYHTETDCFYYPDNNGGDVILRGQCLADNAVPAVNDFDAELFAGTWFEASRFPSGIQEGDCTSTEYLSSGTNTFTVTQTEVNEERLLTTVTDATLSNDGRGVISVTINGVPFNNIFILATDYTEYALAYSCRNIEDGDKQVFSWKLSRSQTGLSDEANNLITQLVDDNIDLWDGYYRATGQDNDACFYYPVFGDQLPPSIELPGPCPDNIRGVSDFRAGDYLGRWYEVARYPVTNQFGQCSQAEYSLAERVVVANSEVADQTLFTQIGFADVASTDGSGQLSVEFTVNGVVRTTNYYILATDYTSYSLVYSCANTDNGRSLVSSWKLSRTPTLSSEASQVINPVIEDTRGLIDEYYQATSQTDEDCFYIPPGSANVSPLFRGQCESITGVQGFDAQRFAGWWYEIESYGTDGSTSGCRSSEYTMVGDSYRVVDTEVQGNDGIHLPGTATVTNDGRLSRTIQGKPNQDVWVLATDYETYALLYSCENVDNEYRRVWSAKHSRSRSLTEDAQNAMAPIITSNAVLYEQLFNNVAQGDAACSYNRILMPGQCNSEIPAQQDFNADDFANTWYHTERYDSVGSSTCVGSTFTVDESARPTGSISILNFEVPSGQEELETVEGTASPSTTDGSARFEVTFPVAGSDTTTSTSVYILSTDYTGYALAYSCVNVNANQRQVRAWKMSRERTMSAESTTAINTLIELREELHQSYFKQIEQNDECPSVAAIVKNSIILLLICAMLHKLF